MSLLNHALRAAYGLSQALPGASKSNRLELPASGRKLVRPTIVAESAGVGYAVAHTTIIKHVDTNSPANNLGGCQAYVEDLGGGSWRIKRGFLKFDAAFNPADYSFCAVRALHFRNYDSGAASDENTLNLQFIEEDFDANSLTWNDQDVELDAEVFDLITLETSGVGVPETHGVIQGVPAYPYETLAIADLSLVSASEIFGFRLKWENEDVSESYCTLFGAYVF